MGGLLTTNRSITSSFFSLPGMMVILFPALFCVFSFVTPVIQVKEGYLLGSDFSYYLLLVDTFWQGHIDEIYSLTAYHSAINQILPGGFSPLAMPLAVTPAAVILLWPLTLFLHWNSIPWDFQQSEFISRGLLPWGYPAAQAFWMSFSLSFLLLELIKLFRELPQKNGIRKLLLLSLLVFAGSSELYLAISLGQTSIFALAALIHLARKCNSNERSTAATPRVFPKLAFPFFSDSTTSSSYSSTFSPIFPLSPVLIIALLSFKPHYWIFALLLAIAKRDYLTAFCGFALSTLLVLAGVSCMSSQWYIYYLASTSVFLQPTIPAAYLAAFAPNMMNLYVTAMAGTVFGESALSHSRFILALTTLAAGTLFGLPLFFQPLRKLFLRYQLLTSSSSRLALALTPLLCFSLFAPYAGHYEDLLLFLPLLVLFKMNDTPKTVRGMGKFIAYLLIAALIPLLNFNIFPEPKPRIVLWLLKLIFSFVIVISMLRQNHDNNSQ